MKYFSLHEANSILPQIKLLVDEIKDKRDKLYNVIESYEEEIENQNDELEIMYLKTEITMMNDEINELIDIIESFGAYVKGLDPFLVDFPSEYNGEQIYLCWQEGEEQIEYWHKASEGFAGRKHISLLSEQTGKDKNRLTP
ncbi:MAG TPA: DUF2203 domain-containing protein [Persephonella sp.]|uniref:DUF2203 domain-containing protein n=1 Tax=Persephonella marina (strain DSM 14350 / EX-H1) TaxID=123214 RepID=C0QTZ5_PERMH|nr:MULTISPECIES: DUF2203 domain-containing protein [Persephonella]ACO04510.1 conserved hypothetical protein [Persephonella marina EX-H1]HCB70223.1 DUF2203 domain-containing protein [Persephonella sp.]